MNVALFRYILCVGMFCLHTLDPLELELLMAVNYNVGAEELNPSPLQNQVFFFIHVFLLIIFHCISIPCILTLYQLHSRHCARF